MYLLSVLMMVLPSVAYFPSKPSSSYKHDVSPAYFTRFVAVSISAPGFLHLRNDGSAQPVQ